MAKKKSGKNKSQRIPSKSEDKKASDKGKLTIRQSRFARVLTERTNQTLGEAAVLAGYSQKNAGQSGHQALEAIKAKSPEIMARLGLNLETIIENHLKPLLHAKETKVFAHEGKITDYADLEDNTTRRYATHTALELLGAFPSEEQKRDMNVGVEVVILDVPRPDRSAINVTPANVKTAPKVSPKLAGNGAKPDPRPKD